MGLNYLPNIESLNFRDHIKMLKSRILFNHFFINFFITCLLIFALSGCATGIPFNSAKDEIPPLKSDMGRIFVYRSFNPLALLKPLVFKLDGKNIADTFASTVFYHDVKPGKHTVNLKDAEKDLSFNLTMGGSVYLRYSIVPDSVSEGNAIVEMIDSKTAKTELDRVRLIEKNLRFPEEHN